MNDPATDRHQLIAALLGPAEPELTCDECFEQLDRYVDLQLARADADDAIPGMRAHLTGCPDHDSLLEFVTVSDASQAPDPRARKQHRPRRR
jgi:hypothetical protein